MKKILVSITLLMILLNLGATGSMAQTNDYKKYGNIAIAVVKADYPGEEVNDYEYVGRVKSKKDEVTDTFRFQVTDGGKPLYVIVKIAHNLKYKKLLSLTVEEQQP